MDRYLKLYVDLFNETRSGVHALVYSFILNQSEYQNTTTPKIEQKYIQNTLKLGRKTVEKVLKELKEDGFIDFQKGYNYANGKAYTTTVFELKYAVGQKETTVSETPVANTPVKQTTFAQEDEEQSHEEQINAIGLSMLDSPDYSTIIDNYTPSYSSTQKTKKPKNKEVWQMSYDERCNAAMEEFYDWVNNVGINITDKTERDKATKNLMLIDLPEKYNISPITTDKYKKWRTQRSAA